MSAPSYTADLQHRGRRLLTLAQAAAPTGSDLKTMTETFSLGAGHRCGDARRRSANVPWRGPVSDPGKRLK